MDGKKEFFFFMLIFMKESKIRPSIERKIFFEPELQEEVKLVYLPLSEINITPPELYIRQAINHKWVTKLREILKEGRELDPILVTRRVEGIDRENIIISGNHRFMAYQGLRETIPVLYLDKEISREEFFRIQFLFSKPELQLKEEDLKEYAKKIYREFSSKGYPKTEIYKKIAEIVNRSERTVRNWLSEFIEKEKEQREELKRKAIELREQGKTIREIAEELGVPQSTVKDWLRTKLETISKTVHSDEKEEERPTLDTMSKMGHPDEEKGDKLDMMSKMSPLEEDTAKNDNMSIFAVPETLSQETTDFVLEFIRNCEDKTECLRKLEEELKAKGVRDFRSVAKVFFENFSREEVLKLLEKRTEEFSDRIYAKGEMKGIHIEERVKTYWYQSLSEVEFSDLERELFELLVAQMEKEIEEEFEKEKNNVPKDLDLNDRADEIYDKVEEALYKKGVSITSLWYFSLILKKVYELLKREEQGLEIDDIPQEEIENDIERESVEVLREEVERAKEEVKEEEENKKETEKERKKKKLLEKFKKFGKGDSEFERLFRQETEKFLISPYDREIFEEYAITKFRYFVDWAWSR